MNFQKSSYVAQDRFASTTDRFLQWLLHLVRIKLPVVVANTFILAVCFVFGLFQATGGPVGSERPMKA
jgi:hypothetical protein